MAVTAVPLTGFLGAQLKGLDLSRSIDRQAKAEVLELFHAHQVVVIRGQEISPDGFIHQLL